MGFNINVMLPPFNIIAFSKKCYVLILSPIEKWYQNGIISIADTDRVAFFYYSFAEIEATLSLIQPKAEIAKCLNSAKGWISIPVFNSASLNLILPFAQIQPKAESSLIIKP